jgi:two-component system cell cycle response regulator
MVGHTQWDERGAVMVRSGPQRVLVVGDAQQQLQTTLSQAMPAAQITSVPTFFEAIAELTHTRYNAILASAEPIERRPESAVRTLRALSPESRLVLFGHPTLEPLSRKMMEFGCDDYVVTPTTPGELNQIFATSLMRIAPAPESRGAVAAPVAAVEESNPLLDGLPLAQILLNSLTQDPQNAVSFALGRINDLLGPEIAVMQTPANAAAPAPNDGRVVVSHVIQANEAEAGRLHLLIPSDQDANMARHLLSRLCEIVGKLQTLQDRHCRLQKLAITDELTGLYNARYFRHFLARIIEMARAKRFPVTLFVFDIDNFKKYNDQFGHGVGDIILKQTAQLMRRCCREHDLVARVGGDEFAVVFWEKEGPRQPKDPKTAIGPARAPQTPLLILERFRNLLSSHDFPELGPSGKGVLTISGSLAVYPYDAQSVEALISAADSELMFKAKRQGKDSILLVGSGEKFMPERGEQ